MGAPRLLHTLQVPESGAILSIVTGFDRIYASDQQGSIHIWKCDDFTLENQITPHSRAILSLILVPGRKWLISASSDSSIQIHHAITLMHVATIQASNNTGNIFSLAWMSSANTLFLGSQSTSIQWHHLPPNLAGTSSPLNLSSHSRNKEKFFGAGGSSSGHSSPERQHSNGNLQYTPNNSKFLASNTQILNIQPHCIYHNAHFGYVYALSVTQKSRLVSAGGDGSLKVWNVTPESQLELVSSLPDAKSGILSLATSSQTIYAGTQGGIVLVYDLETCTVLRSLSATSSDVLNIVCAPNLDFFTAHEDGSIVHWSSDIHSRYSWTAHSSVVLALTTKNDADDSKQSIELLSADDCGALKSWEITLGQRGPSGASRVCSSSQPDLLANLALLIRIPSLSGNVKHKEDCRKAAITLKEIFEQLGAADAKLLPTIPERNPLVYAAFKSKSPPNANPRKRVLFYGHYDCIPATEEEWKITHPYVMKGHNGYVYGRGVSDNKGPILAAAFATHSLLINHQLDVDVVFLIEGEEESGSFGFQEAVLRHKEEIGEIDVILVSNSYWIGDDRPCITYGLRGVIHSKIDIRNARKQMHSGVHGGATSEPMSDMISLLSKLSDRNHINIPAFYNDVAKITDTERDHYVRLAEATGKSAEDLIARWQSPNLTIHDINSSGEHNNTVIPSTVTANVSVRIVPHQSISSVGESLKHYLESAFSGFQSSNSIQVEVRHHADWWLGSPNGVYSKLMETSISEVWGVEALRIREGGSIPSIPFLQSALGGQSFLEAVHLPLGQSSDNAHLADERIKLENLQKGQSVFEVFFQKVGSQSPHHDQNIVLA